MAAFVSKRLSSVLMRTCTLKDLIPNCPLRTFHLTSTHFQRSQATEEVLKAVSDELKFVDKSVHKLPEVPAFSCSTEGAVATFSRKFGNESITITVDANSGVEMDTMGVGGPQDEDEVETDDEMEEEDSATAPAFTVSISKPSGNKMQLECSYAVTYDEVSNSEELRMTIDSVSMIPKESTNVETVYSAEGDQLGRELYDSLEDYLEERGIDHAFGSELLNFYTMFEHKTYATNFLEKVKSFCHET